MFEGVPYNIIRTLQDGKIVAITVDQIKERFIST